MEDEVGQIDKKKLKVRKSEGEVVARNARRGERDIYRTGTVERSGRAPYRAETELCCASQGDDVEDEVGPLDKKRFKVRKLEDEVVARKAMNREEDMSIPGEVERSAPAPYSYGNFKNLPTAACILTDLNTTLPTNSVHR